MPGNKRARAPTEKQKRFVELMKAACSGDELQAYLDHHPGSTTLFLTAIFRGNKMTHAQRESIGKQLGMKLTGKPPAQRLAQGRRQSNGGLPLLPSSGDSLLTPLSTEKEIL